MQPDNVTFNLAFNWKLSVLGLLMLPLLLHLGFWQLERAQQKQQLQHSIAQQRQLPALKNMAQLLLQDSAKLQHRKIHLQGRFDKQRYWLLDNKIRQGKVGYEVIAPFVDSNGKTWLVNRGWVAAPPLRSELPAIETGTGVRHIEGHIYQPGKNLLSNSSQVETPLANAQWPKRIQHVDSVELYRQLPSEPMFSYVLRLEALSDGALVTQWQWINTSPGKHQGYAVQWFAMAAVLAVALVFANSNLAQMMRQRWH